MGILFNLDEAQEQGRSKGLQPRWDGDRRSEKWTPPLRYAKQKTGIVDVYSGGNRKDSRKNSADVRKTRKDSDGVIHRGYRSLMREKLRYLYGRPIR
jgi:hypothetical protein